MKLKVGKVKNLTEELPDPNVYIALRQGDDGVHLVAVTEYGDVLPSGYLLTLSNNGKIFRHPCVSPSLGFELDGRERIVIVEE